MAYDRFSGWKLLRGNFQRLYSESIHAYYSYYYYYFHRTQTNFSLEFGTKTRVHKVYVVEIQIHYLLLKPFNPIQLNGWRIFISPTWFNNYFREELVYFIYHVVVVVVVKSIYQVKSRNLIVSIRLPYKWTLESTNISSFQNSYCLLFKF